MSKYVAILALATILSGCATIEKIGEWYCETPKVKRSSESWLVSAICDEDA